MKNKYLHKILNLALNSSLFRSAGIYTLTSGINSAIPFFLLPILTRYMSAVDYGIVSMFGVLILFITPFTSLSVDDIIPRIYFEKDSVDIKVYVTNLLLMMVCSTAIIGILFYIFAEPISRLSSISSQYLWIVIAISFGQSITVVVRTIFQAQVKPIKYGIYQVLITVLNAGLSILLVVYLRMAWQGRMDAQIITFTIFAIIGIIILWKSKWFKFKYNVDYIKHALRFGVPLIPHAVAGMVITMTDRLFITNLVGLEATGIYAVAYQVGTIINIINDSYNRAFLPWLYERLKLNQLSTKRTIVKLTYGYFLVITILAMGLALISPWFLSFFVGKEFSGSAAFVVWIAMGFAFQGMYLLVVSYIYYVQRTAILAWVTFITAVVNIGINYFFIRSYGAMGAAYSNTLVNLLKFILVWILASKVFEMPWNLLKARDV